MCDCVLVLAEPCVSVYPSVRADRLLTKLPSSSQQLCSSNSNNPVNHICKMEQTEYLDKKQMKRSATVPVTMIACFYINC